ncbi:MAG TPA: hypothetical protein VMT46_01895 [Anaerolineaceae bacterium]|nr:hypothetical protein [Anaerolineaceae bacterium]
MTMNESLLIKRTLLVLLILVGLGFAIYPGLSAQMEARHCSATPVVILADGSTVMLSATIGTEAIYVQNIYYTLHVPRGKTLKEVMNTAGVLGGHETVTVIADNDPGKYSSSTLVSVIASQVPVTTSIMVDDTQSAAISGFSNQRLVALLQ